MGPEGGRGPTTAQHRLVPAAGSPGGPTLLQKRLLLVGLGWLWVGWAGPWGLSRSGYGLLEVSGRGVSGCFSTLRTPFLPFFVHDLLQAPSDLRLPFCPSVFSPCLGILIFIMLSVSGVAPASLSSSLPLLLCLHVLPLVFFPLLPPLPNCTHLYI